jgi:hypothetical protein
MGGDTEGGWMDNYIWFSLIATIGVLAAIADMVHQKRTTGSVDANNAMRWFFRTLAAGAIMFFAIAILDLYLASRPAHSK